MLQGAESSRILCEEDSFLCGELSLRGGMRWEAYVLMKGVVNV